MHNYSFEMFTQKNVSNHKPVSNACDFMDYWHAGWFTVKYNGCNIKTYSKYNLVS